MKLIADTNLILRILLRDDERQFALAAKALSEAEAVIHSTVALCEAAWVLRTAEKWERHQVAAAFRALLDDARVLSDRASVERGLAMLDAGGDFADGVIAADGLRHADAPFATFDRQAARLLEEQGVAVTLLG